MMAGMMVCMYNRSIWCVVEVYVERRSGCVILKKNNTSNKKPASQPPASQQERILASGYIEVASYIFIGLYIWLVCYAFITRSLATTSSSALLLVVRCPPAMHGCKNQESSLVAAHSFYHDVRT